MWNGRKRALRPISWMFGDPQVTADSGSIKRTRPARCGNDKGCNSAVCQRWMDSRDRNLDATATVTRTVITDDLDGSEGDVSTFLIALDNVRYEIDLSAANEARLRDKLAKFIDAATEVKTKPAVRRGRKIAAAANTRPDKEQTKAIREWARAQGHPLPSVAASPHRSRKRLTPLTKPPNRRRRPRRLPVFGDDRTWSSPTLAVVQLIHWTATTWPQSTSRRLRLR